jgi:hypothetical protein
VSEIVNLRQVRKQKRRTEAVQAARENRVLHGRTRAEKTEAADATRRREARLDAKKLD